MPVETNNKRSIKPPKAGQLGGSLLIFLTVLLILNFIAPSFGPQPQQVAYSDFVAQVQADKVARAIVGDNRIEYVLKTDITQQPAGSSAEFNSSTGRVFVTTPVALDLDLPKILREL